MSKGKDVQLTISDFCPKFSEGITKISKPSDVSVLHDVRNRQSAAQLNVKELLFPADFSTVPIVLSVP